MLLPIVGCALLCQLAFETILHRQAHRLVWSGLPLNCDSLLSDFRLCYTDSCIANEGTGREWSNTGPLQLLGSKRNWRISPWLLWRESTLLIPWSWFLCPTPCDIENLLFLASGLRSSVPNACIILTRDLHLEDSSCLPDDWATARELPPASGSPPSYAFSTWNVSSRDGDHVTSLANQRLTRALPGGEETGAMGPGGDAAISGQCPKGFHGPNSQICLGPRPPGATTWFLFPSCFLSVLGLERWITGLNHWLFLQRFNS